MFHTRLLFEYRTNRSPLGKWPPVDETVDLLNAPLYKLSRTEDGLIESEVLTGPRISL